MNTGIHLDASMSCSIFFTMIRHSVVFPTAAGARRAKRFLGNIFSLWKQESYLHQNLGENLDLAFLVEQS